MAQRSNIEWTEATWNPIVGCSVLSPGCKRCYAMRTASRLALNPATPYYAGTVQMTKEGSVWTGKLAQAPDRVLFEPLRTRRPTTWFVNSMGDLFHEAIPDAWIDRVFAVMALARRHTFQVLTKRSKRMRAYLERLTMNRLRDAVIAGDWPLTKHEADAWLDPNATAEHRALYRAQFTLLPLANVWLGVSTEDQTHADERIPDLLATPAAVRFISAEPLLGPIDLRASLPDAWKIKAPIRTWGDFSWPDWVPLEVREQIVSFWNPEWGRGPNAWIRSAIENGQPPMGTTGAFRLCIRGEHLVEGRFVPAWNNIGRVIDDGGQAHVVSVGTYQSQPPRLGWVICGGESGKGARPMHPDWARSLRDQCQAAGVAFFFKQWGEWAPAEGLASEQMESLELENRYERLGDVDLVHLGKRAAGRLLDGREWNEMPAAIGAAAE